MAAMVERAQTGKAHAQRLADRISSVFVPVVITVAIAVLGAWIGAGYPPASGVHRRGRCADHRLPLRAGTGHPPDRTSGRYRPRSPTRHRDQRPPRSPRIHPNHRHRCPRQNRHGHHGTDDTRPGHHLPPPPLAKTCSPSLERWKTPPSTPVAAAIAAGAAAEVGPLDEVDDFRNFEGRGVRGLVQGRVVTVGRPTLLAEHDIAVDDPHLNEAQAAAEEAGQTAVLVGWNGRAHAVLAVADAIKPTSAHAIARLTALGVTPILLTGDNQTVADAVAAEVGIDTVIANVLPADKAAVITDLQSDGKVVAMIGDGVNDAAALAHADLGLAMGTGTDAAMHAADITLVRGDLNAAADAIALARTTLKTIKMNLFWAFAYNVAAIPLAALGLLNPMLAGGAAMALSSVFVVSNSLRLRAFTSPPPLIVHSSTHQPLDVYPPGGV